MQIGGNHVQRLMPCRAPGTASSSAVGPAPALAQDLIRGAEDIAQALGVTVAQVYRISKRIASGAKFKRPMPPIFNDGVSLCLRKSSLEAYYAKLEQPARSAAGVF